MATISNTPRPGYVFDVTDNVWYPIGVGGHSHSEIAKTIADAKGDLIVGTAADTVDRLAVGNNGETLVADSSTSSGLRYQTGVNLNGVINGGYDIWQRSTSVTFASSATTTYNAADRWAFSHSGTSASTTISRQTATNNGSQYALRLQRVSGQTTTPYYFLYNVLETSDTAKFAGKTVTLSVWVKAGANYSGGSGAFMQIRTGTGTDQSAQSMIDGSWTGYASNSQSITPTTTSTRYSYTLTLGSTVTQLGINLGYLTSGTAGANDWLEFEQVQLEVGSVATNFKRAGGGTLQGELAACQRYYEENDGTIIQTVANGGLANGYATSFTYQVTKRATPTLTIFSGADQSGTSGSATWYVSGTGTAATADQEANQKTFFTLRRTATATNTLVSFSFTSSAEL